MKFKLIVVTSMMVFLAGAFPAIAGGCRLQTYAAAAPVYHAPTYQAPYVAPTYHANIVQLIPAIFVPAPSFSVGYSAPTPAAVQQQTTTTTTTAGNQALDKFDLMLAEIKAMRVEQREAFVAMGALKAVPKVVTPKDEQGGLTAEQKRDVEEAIAVFKKPYLDTGVSCQSCHSKGQPPEKSADFHMFDQAGNFQQISDDLAKSMARKISKERKCPGSPYALTGEDKAKAEKVLPKLPG